MLNSSIGYSLFGSEKDARHCILTIMLEKKMFKWPSTDEWKSYHSLQELVWNLPVEWIPAEDHPMINPPGGQRNSYFDGIEGLPCVVLRDAEGNPVWCAAFHGPDKCFHCEHRYQKKTGNGFKLFPFCKVDNRFCGRRICEGCNDFLTDGWKTDREFALHDIREGWNPWVGK